MGHLRSLAHSYANAPTCILSFKSILTFYLFVLLFTASDSAVRYVEHFSLQVGEFDLSIDEQFVNVSSTMAIANMKLIPFTPIATWDRIPNIIECYYNGNAALHFS